MSLFYISASFDLIPIPSEKYQRTTATCMHTFEAVKLA